MSLDWSPKQISGWLKTQYPDVPQLQVDGKKAALGPQGRLPGFSVRLTGSIRRTAAMSCDLPAHTRYRSL